MSERLTGSLPKTAERVAYFLDRLKQHLKSIAPDQSRTLDATYGHCVHEPLRSPGCSSKTC